MNAVYDERNVRNINLNKQATKPTYNEPVELVWNEEKQWYEAATKRTKAVST